MEKLLEEGEVFEIKGVKCQILSVGNHQVDGEDAGFSYSFRTVEEIKNDPNLKDFVEKVK